MRVLLDQNCPERIGPELTGHEVVPARALHWATLTNGQLLREAEAAGFDVMLTADRNLRYQQNLSGRRIAVVVLSLNKLVTLLEHIDLVHRALDRCTPGSFEEVEIPGPSLRRRPSPKPKR